MISKIWVIRISLLFCFALFWGGLTFYTGFVVPIAHDILINPMDGGLITQRVTRLLQWLGASYAVLMAVNALVVRNQQRRLGNALLACSVILAMSIAGLAIVHRQLDSVIDIQEGLVTDQATFDDGHRHYNQLTTVEWLVTLASLPITLIAWRQADSQGPKQDTFAID